MWIKCTGGTLIHVSQNGDGRCLCGADFERSQLEPIQKLEGGRKCLTCFEKLSAHYVEKSVTPSNSLHLILRLSMAQANHQGLRLNQAEVSTLLEELNDVFNVNPYLDLLDFYGQTFDLEQTDRRLHGL